MTMNTVSVIVWIVVAILACFTILCGLFLKFAPPEYWEKLADDFAGKHKTDEQGEDEQ